MRSESYGRGFECEADGKRREGGLWWQVCLQLIVLLAENERMLRIVNEFDRVCR